MKQFRTLVSNLVLTEETAQDKKWGVQGHSDGIWSLILAEEIGEAAKEALEKTSSHCLPLEWDVVQPLGGDSNAQIEELVQAAAVIHQWIECLLRRQASQPSQPNQLTV